MADPFLVPSFGDEFVTDELSTVDQHQQYVPPGNMAGTPYIDTSVQAQQPQQFIIASPNQYVFTTGTGNTILTTPVVQANPGGLIQQIPLQLLSPTKSPPAVINLGGSPPGVPQINGPVAVMSSPANVPVTTVPATTSQVTPTPVSPVKPRVTRGRKKKDPNSPSAPMSAYAFFFKETQASVKNHNPSAKFGEVSKIVSSMWEALDDASKAVYKKKSDEDKQRYHAEMEVYRQQQAMAAESSVAAEVASVMGPVQPKSPLDPPAPSLVQTQSPVKPEDITDHECIRNGCVNKAIKNAEWEDEYCSNDCVIAHCSDVFSSWVADQRSND